jgi:hypothetical protein
MPDTCNVLSAMCYACDVVAKCYVLPQPGST